MSEDSIKQEMRRICEKSWHVLDDESFYVHVSKGKAANVYDFSCHDKSGWRLIKVCLGTISHADLERLLAYNECRDPDTIIEILFWNRHDHRPFYRSKLYYNQPKQPIPAPLQKLVK